MWCQVFWMNMDVLKKLSCVRLIHKALRATFMESWCFRDVALQCFYDVSSEAGHSSEDPTKYESWILPTTIIDSSYKVSDFDTFVRSKWFKKRTASGLAAVSVFASQSSQSSTSVGCFHLNPFMSMSHSDYIKANSVVTVQNWIICL